MHTPELRLRLRDHPAIEARLIVIGAHLIADREITDTYFWHHQDRAIKITADGANAEITRLHKTDHGFMIESKERIDSHQEILTHLAHEHGVHKVIVKRRKTFTYKFFTIHLDHIPEHGYFLVVQGQGAHGFLETLGVREPEYVRTPFSEL